MNYWKARYILDEYPYKVVLKIMKRLVVAGDCRIKQKIDIMKLEVK